MACYNNLLVSKLFQVKHILNLKICFCKIKTWKRILTATVWLTFQQPTSTVSFIATQSVPFYSMLTAHYFKNSNSISTTPFQSIFFLSFFLYSYPFSRQYSSIQLVHTSPIPFQNKFIPELGSNFLTILQIIS